MNTEVVDLLKRARARIAVPERWTKRVQARNVRRQGVPAYSAKACQWCAMGALIVADGRSKYMLSSNAGAALDRLQANCPPTRGQLKPLAAFNDRRTTTHAEVLALFDRTIAELEAAE